MKNLKNTNTEEFFSEGKDRTAKLIKESERLIKTLKGKNLSEVEELFEQVIILLKRRPII